MAEEAVWTVVGLLALALGGCLIWLLLKYSGGEEG
jgi:hypothetical protein